jgi:hypothetical protein
VGLPLFVYKAKYSVGLTPMRGPCYTLGVTRKRQHISLRRIAILTAALVLLPLLGPMVSPNGLPAIVAGPLAAGQFADPSFQQLWQRTDALVSAGAVQRSWYWGPQPGETHSEPYTASASGTRLVQYFDKARMEINNPSGDRNSEWFVTTGLLVAEMVSGKQQVGDKEYRLLAPAEIAVGGDGLGSDPDAPTYTSFRAVASLTGPGANRAQDRTGQTVTATINRAGKIGDEPALGLYAGARLGAYSDVLGHNIPQAMWDFLNLNGAVELNGTRVEGQQIANWVFVMGYPITEPYWSRVKIDNVYVDVLFQMYERRTLAYIPSFTKEWQVQMGNVGAHYKRWLYGGPLPSPVAQLPGGSKTPPPLPAPVDATILPSSAAVGTPVFVSLNGFRPGEEIVSWFTGPDGTARDAHLTPNATLDGTVSGLAIATTGLSVGQWAITFHGKASNHESIAYFYLFQPDPSAPTATPTGTPAPQVSTTPAVPTRVPTSPPQGTVSPTPTEPVVPTEPAGGLILSVRPPYGPPDAQFSFEARGLQAGEGVQVKFTDPNHTVVYPAGSNNGQYQAAGDGTLVITLVPTQAFPAAPTGTWLFELDGLQSGLQGVTGFALR